MLFATMRAVVCLALCLSVCQVRGSHITAKMNRTIQNLLQHYRIPLKEKFNGKPVFDRGPLADRMETKRVFMGGVLETYEKLIGQMLKELPTPSPHTAGSSNEGLASAITAGPGTTSDTRSEEGGDVKMELNYILKKVQDLKRHKYQEQDKLLQRLQALKHIQMDNFVIQSKALWELPRLYEEASSLPDDIRMQRRRRRRRRQARRDKTRPRA
ncbi:interferon gamma 1 precursor [Lates calcarifer]|uniref:Interferon gamma 1 n=1 Tax=Lates calcarifer TaxID=8187 RepID=A0A4W6CY08_LATCA|nr:interferon gamma 1 precursor [Lates calcarifer]